MRSSIHFVAVKMDKRKTNRLLCQSVARGDLRQIESLVLRDGGDIEYLDDMGRTLRNIAEQSERLLPAEKDAVRELLEDLPGRLGVTQKDAKFTGLKLNQNATKHKFFARNRELVKAYSEQILKGTKATVVPRFEPETLAKQILIRNPDLLKVPQEQVTKVIAAWTKAVGGELTVNALSTNGALLYSNPVSVADNAPPWAQLLGHSEVRRAGGLGSS